MKKRLAVTLALVMLISLCSCGSNSGSNAKYADSDYLGTWELVGYQVEDREIELEEHGATQLTLNADGTFVDVSEAYIEGDDETESSWQTVTTEGTWEETDNGFKTTDDIFTLEYTVNGNKATAEYEDTILIRKRSK